MCNQVFTKNYPAPPINTREILCYAGCKGVNGAEIGKEIGLDMDERLYSLMEECLKESESACAYRVCWRVFDVKRKNDSLEIGKLCTNSKALWKNLENCSRAIVFAATVGLDMDRLISKYASIATARALMLQAIGAERIEALCDVFCAECKEIYGNIKPRFSAGYGDFPLQAQKDIFVMLDCAKHIGLTLNDSLLMTPTKSVTAIVGIVAEG